ncbi:cytochrome P450 [Copromyces sp. CBS 386.78]|nr:cytochrome P450 [Copromyces sp. CBS 386.78]
MIISPPRINLRRAASYHYDKGPLSATSSRFNFDHLMFSPPPSPGLPSLSPPPRKPSKGFAGYVRPRRVVRYILYTCGLSPVLGFLSRPYDHSLVSRADLPDHPAPILLTDSRGRTSWTVSIPQGSEFPLTAEQFADVCEKCRETAERKGSIQQTYLGFLFDTTDSHFVDVKEAQQAGYLPAAPADRSQDAVKTLVGETVEGGIPKPVCEKSLTFVLESDDAGLGKTLMMLWTAYGLAQKEGRAFFIDDSRWGYGKYMDIFQAPPREDCGPPPRHEMLPCPLEARHLVVSTWTAIDVFGETLVGAPSDDPLKRLEPVAQKNMFNLARLGHDALFRLNKDDNVYVDNRVRDLMARRIVPKTKGKQNGLAIGIHVRRGDRHPFEFQYRSSYVPINIYAETAREILEDKFNHTGPHGAEDAVAKKHSLMILASDDPMIYQASELKGASLAQERIKLAAKQEMKQPELDRNVMHKFHDEAFGWEGGFFSAMFWNLGQSSSSADVEAHKKRPSADAIRLRSLVGRAYMMDLAVLADASDVVICTVSAVGCRLLAVMMGWESAVEKGNWVNIDGGSSPPRLSFSPTMGVLQVVAGPLSQQFSQLGTFSQIGVAVASFLFVAVAINVLQQFLFKKPNEPPLVFHWFPLIGSTITYGMDPPRFFKENREKYGDCFTFILLGKKTTVYVGPKGNDFILNGKIRDVNAEEIYTVLTTPVFGKDVVYDCPNSKLMEQKKFMKIALTTEAFRQYVPIISDEVTSYLKRTADFKGKSGIVDIPPKMAQITIFTASHALQGKEIRDKFDEKLADLYHDLDMGFSPINFMLHWAPLPWNNRRDYAQRTVAKIYMDTIKERRARGETGAQDIMWHLMNSTYKGDIPVPDHEVAHMMIALLMAGQHSSSSTSSWIMLRLASRPDIMEDLYNEQVKNLGADLPPLTYEDFAKLPLHAAIVKETLRLHAPIHSIMRAVKTPMPVPGTKYVIPTDHVLLAAPGVSATDESYFPQPDLWEPHRWEKDSPLAPTIVRNVQNEDDDEKIDYGYGLVSKGANSPYLPFGAGRHRCIGEQFASVQLQTILAIIVRNFKFRNVDGSDKVIGTDYASLFSRPLEPAKIYWERREGCQL